MRTPSLCLFACVLAVCVATAAEDPAGRRILFASEGAGKVMILGKDGRIEWEYPAEMSRDAWLLPGGNVLFCYNNLYQPEKHDNPAGVMEVTAKKETVFDFRTTGQVWSCQRLADGNTLVGASSQGKLLLVSPAGKIVKEIPLKSQGGHSCLRNARQTATGTFLVAEESAHAIREYAADGTLIHERKVAFPPYSAVRQANGHTLACGLKSLLELDPDGATTWSLADTEVAAAGIRWFAGIQALPNGNIVVCNAGGKIPLFEVSRDKKIVWQWNTRDPVLLLGHGIQLPDVPGVPLK